MSVPRTGIHADGQRSQSSALDVDESSARYAKSWTHGDGWEVIAELRGAKQPPRLSHAAERIAGEPIADMIGRCDSDETHGRESPGWQADKEHTDETDKNVTQFACSCEMKSSTRSASNGGAGPRAPFRLTSHALRASSAM